MRRRKFLLSSLAAALGLPAFGGRAFGEEPTPANTFEIPGFGPVTLDPAQLDPAKIAELFEQNFPAAVGQLRAKYGDAIKALSEGNGQGLAEMAGPLIQRASMAAALPFVGKGLEESLMSPPKVGRTISKGVGEPIFYVNGIFTSLKLAYREAQALQQPLPGRVIELFYNEGTDPKVNQQLAGKDLEEAYRDRVWPVTLTSTLSGKSLGGGLQAALGGEPLQHNPTTRELAFVLYQHAKQKPTTPVALIGYSQGSMIVRNALFTLALLGQREFVEQRVAFVAPGLPINRKEVWPLPKKFTPIVDPSDPVPAYFGLEGDGLKAQGAAVEHHQWFGGGYVSKIKPEMLAI